MHKIGLFFKIDLNLLNGRIGQLNQNQRGSDVSSTRAVEAGGWEYLAAPAFATAPQRRPATPCARSAANCSGKHCSNPVGSFHRIAPVRSTGGPEPIISGRANRPAAAVRTRFRVDQQQKQNGAGKPMLPNSASNSRLARPRRTNAGLARAHTLTNAMADPDDIRFGSTGHRVPPVAYPSASGLLAPHPKRYGNEL